MLVIAMVLEDYMGQYGIVWNSSVVEVASTTFADIIEEILIVVICTPNYTPKKHRKQEDSLKLIGV